MIEGETEVELLPQGTLVEQIRAGVYGLGSILTTTALDTKVEEGKDKVVVDGKEYLLEKPLRAGVDLLFANKVDKYGNMSFHGSTRNFNVMMAAAAEITVVEACEVVEIGDLNPDKCIHQAFSSQSRYDQFDTLPYLSSTSFLINPSDKGEN